MEKEYDSTPKMINRLININLQIDKHTDLYIYPDIRQWAFRRKHHLGFASFFSTVGKVRMKVIEDTDKALLVIRRE